MSDDNELITGEWLESCKWVYARHRRAWAWQGIYLSEFIDRNWRIQIGGTGNFWEYFPNPTRGNLRAICRALDRDFPEEDSK